MTTKVQVINHGPGPVVMEVVNHVAVDSYVTVTDVAQSHRINPNSVGPEIYVYAQQHIRVKEVK